MEPMMKIINALAALTAALQEYTAQTTEGYINTFEEIYDPEKDEPQAAEAPKEQPSPKNEEPTVTFVQLRSRESKNYQEPDTGITFSSLQQRNGQWYYLYRPPAVTVG